MAVKVKSCPKTYPSKGRIADSSNSEKYTFLCNRNTFECISYLLLLLNLQIFIDYQAPGWKSQRTRNIWDTRQTKGARVETMKPSETIK